MCRRSPLAGHRSRVASWRSCLVLKRRVMRARSNGSPSRAHHTLYARASRVASRIARRFCHSRCRCVLETQTGGIPWEHKYKSHTVVRVRPPHPARTRQHQVNIAAHSCDKYWRRKYQRRGAVASSANALEHAARMRSHNRSRALCQINVCPRDATERNSRRQWTIGKCCNTFVLQHFSSTRVYYTRETTRHDSN